MSNFACWNESNTDEEAADRVEARDAESAAEQFASDELDNSAGECGSRVEVHVRCPDGSLEIYDVVIDYEPTFRAKKREK